MKDGAEARTSSSSRWSRRPRPQVDPSTQALLRPDRAARGRAGGRRSGRAGRAGDAGARRAEPAASAVRPATARRRGQRRAALGRRGAAAATSARGRRRVRGERPAAGRSPPHPHRSCCARTRDGAASRRNGRPLAGPRRAGRGAAHARDGPAGQEHPRTSAPRSRRSRRRARRERADGRRRRPSLDLDAVRSLWPAVLETLRAGNAPLGRAARGAARPRSRDDELTLAFGRGGGVLQAQGRAGRRTASRRRSASARSPAPRCALALRAARRRGPAADEPTRPSETSSSTASWRSSTPRRCPRRRTRPGDQRRQA